jgi:hypothetical protein
LRKAEGKKKEGVGKEGTEERKKKKIPFYNGKMINKWRRSDVIEKLPLYNCSNKLFRKFK